jgi:hypothetical protein
VLLSDPALRQIAKNLEAGSNELHGALADTHETLGYIRDDFKPTTHRFWHNLLHLLR